MSMNSRESVTDTLRNGVLMSRKYEVDVIDRQEVAIRFDAEFSPRGLGKSDALEMVKLTHESSQWMTAQGLAAYIAELVSIFNREFTTKATKDQLRYALNSERKEMIDVLERISREIDTPETGDQFGELIADIDQYVIDIEERIDASGTR